MLTTGAMRLVKVNKHGTILGPLRLFAKQPTPRVTAEAL